MGAHAFQERVEELAAATQSRSLDMPKSAEVVTLHRVSIVRHVSRLTERFRKLRTGYVVALLELPSNHDSTLNSIDRAELENARAVLDSFAEALSIPTLIDPDGDDCAMAIDGLAATWARTSSDDGRYARRLAKKLRTAGEACDGPRVKLRAAVSKMLAEITIRLDIDIPPAAVEFSERTRYDDAFEKSLARYPVITAHLAR